MAVRFSTTIAGVVIEQEDDGSWHAIESPSAYGCNSVEQVVDLTGAPPVRMSLDDMGYAWTGTIVQELIVELVTQTWQYRETIREVTGPPMMPISNQPWCPDADEHMAHIQCRECIR